MNSRIILSSLALLIIIGFAQNSFASSQNSTLDSQGNYASPSLGISFQAPSGWTVEEPKKSDPSAPDIAIIAPYSAGFTSSVSFIVEKSNGTSLDDYVKNKQAQLVNNPSNNVTLLSVQHSSMGGLPTIVSLMQENFSSQGSNNVVEFKQTVIQANDKFYTITYASEKSNFNSDLSSYDQLLNSTKFTNDDLSFFDFLSIGIVVTAVIGGMTIMKKKSRSEKNHPKNHS